MTQQSKGYEIQKYLKELSINCNLYLNMWNFISENWSFYHPEIPLSEQFCLLLVRIRQVLLYLPRTGICLWYSKLTWHRSSIPELISNTSVCTSFYVSPSRINILNRILIIHIDWTVEIRYFCIAALGARGSTRMLVK